RNKLTNDINSGKNVQSAIQELSDIDLVMLGNSPSSIGERADIEREMKKRGLPVKGKAYKSSDLETIVSAKWPRLQKEHDARKSSGADMTLREVVQNHRGRIGGRLPSSPGEKKDWFKLCRSTDRLLF